MNDLTGKVAVVTGASRGIGAGIARGMARAGASVVVNYASGQAAAEQVVAQITDQGGRAVSVQGDVSRAADVQRLFSQARQAFGPLDILVNNAGVSGIGPVEQTTEDDYHRIFDTNVLGTVLCIREAVLAFGASGGNIINIGSLAAVTPVPGLSIYAASKGALNELTRTLALELGARNIRVNLISPGSTHVGKSGPSSVSGMERHLGELIRTRSTLGRAGTPDDIARVAVFLASEDAAWITGELMTASGGLRF